MTRSFGFYGTTAGRQLDTAQAEIGRHATSRVDGLCVTCGVPGPCPRRETAIAIFSRYHRLQDPPVSAAGTTAP
jgi:hypothetical protein